MTRRARKTVIQHKLEATYGVNPGDVGSDDALLVSDPSFRIDRDVIPRKLARGYLGGSEHLIGTRRAEIEFTIELASAGTAGDVPPWGRLLRSCGFSETIVPGARVEYWPVSESFESGAMRFFSDGVMYVSRGARGTFDLMMSAYDVPKARFKFMGFDTRAFEQAALSTQDYSPWQRPFVLTDDNASEIRIGGVRDAAGISGGTLLTNRGVQISAGNTVSHLKLLGGEEIDITGRDVSGKMEVVLSAADEVAWRTDINSNVLTSLGFQYGSADGERVVIWAPNVQRVDPQGVDYEGRLLLGTELRLLPTLGNDELLIVAR